MSGEWWETRREVEEQNSETVKRQEQQRRIKCPVESGVGGTDDGRVTGKAEIALLIGYKGTGRACHGRSGEPSVVEEYEG